MSKHGQNHNEQTPTPFDVLVEEAQKEFEGVFSLCSKNYVCETCDEKRNWLHNTLTHTAHAVREATVREILGKSFKPWNYLHDEPGTVAMVKAEDIEALAHSATLSTKEHEPHLQ